VVVQAWPAVGHEVFDAVAQHVEVQVRGWGADLDGQLAAAAEFQQGLRRVGGDRVAQEDPAPQCIPVDARWWRTVSQGMRPGAGSARRQIRVSVRIPAGSGVLGCQGSAGR
jgi:hypothetical protein